MGTDDEAHRGGASRKTLKRRAELLGRMRTFMADRAILEVETPVIQRAPNRDHGVAPLRLADGRWLATSPEHFLKRLVAAGLGDCWSLGPVGRAGDHGRRHREEFRLLEWYRLGRDDRELAAETVDLCEAVCGFGWEREELTWREAFARHAGIDDVVTAPEAVLREALAGAAVAGGDRAVLEDQLYVERVEPRLGDGRWTILTEYPPDRAAQARLRPGADGRTVAARFEVYGGGLELANGYHELGDAAELRERLAAVDLGDDALDERYLAAVERGLPDCAGVALGFDRLVMLALGMDDIAAVMAFPDG